MSILKYLPIAFIGIHGFVALHAQPKTADTAGIRHTFTDIAYAGVSAAEKLDIYLPDKGNGPYPVIISIHGGAFMYGDKADEQLNPMLAGLTHGYAIVSINYRMSGEALFPKNIQDVKAAIRWVKAHAKEYDFNANKIALWGGSAGGNLAALAGTAGDVKELEDLSLGNAGESSRVQAVVDWFGPTNFLLMDEQLTANKNGAANHSEADSPESKVLGKKITEIPGLVKQANPETYISKDDPPFLVEHGTKDPVVPVEQSINFAKKIESIAGKQKVMLHLLQGAGHGTPEFETKENLHRVFVFLDSILK